MLCWRDEVAAGNLDNLVREIFGARVTHRIDCFLRAPASDREAWLKQLAEQKGLPLQRPDGKTWSSYQLLSAGQRARLGRYEEQLLSKGVSDNVIVNLSQNAHHAPAQTAGLVPTLTRNSMMWTITGRRFVLPMEHFELMGVSVYGGTSCDVVKALTKLSDHKLRGLSGNAMHAAQLAAVLLIDSDCDLPHS